MTDEPRRRQVVRLERSHRALWSWLGRFVRLIAAVGLCVIVIGQSSDTSPVDRSAECAAAVRAKRQDAVQVCRFEYQRTRAPATGALLAEALFYVDDDEATEVANSLLDTQARADALYVLGSIARDEGKSVYALKALQEARSLHRLELKPWEQARDDAALANVRVDRGEFAEALQLIDECITEAERSGDTDLQCRCHLSAARALIHVGNWWEAQRELDIAKPLASNDTRRSDVEYQSGNFAQESGHHATAIAEYQNALRYRSLSKDTPWIINTELNLAYSFIEHGELDEAKRYLDSATLLDAEHKHEAARTWVDAQLAYRQHDLARAANLTDKFFELLGPEDPGDPDDGDDRINVAVLRARIELERNELKEAATWARRGVEHAEGIRRTQLVLELRPWVLAKRREPYELLFIARARSQQFEAAAMAFDNWQGRTVQDSLATSRPPASLGYFGVAEQLAKLGPWLRVASQAASGSNPDGDAAVLQTMQRIDLVALIVADGDVWRLVADHGPPHLSKIKPLAEILALVDPFRSHPTTEVELAAELGALLLPESAFRATREVLHVIVDGQLQGLPVAALRRGPDPLITMRPIVRLLRLPETHCARAARSGPAIVLGAADAKIPLATVEAEQVARLLQTTSQTGGAATKAALFATADPAVLHVAAHGAMGIGGASLVLADGEVSALEIRAHGLAPSLVVLTACATAEADDPELAGSLAAGFLGAGSHHVVATLRRISDAGGLKIATSFYDAGGVADPPRALAAVQSELAKTDDADWPNFVVFGPEVCADDSFDAR